MIVGTIITENMVSMFAPDGAWQPSISGENMAECIAMIELMASTGMGMSFTELSDKGFKLLPVEVTIKITGTEEEAFQEMKKSI